MEMQSKRLYCTCFLLAPGNLKILILSASKFCVQRYCPSKKSDIQASPRPISQPYKHRFCAFVRFAIAADLKILCDLKNISTTFKDFCWTAIQDAIMATPAQPTEPSATPAVATFKPIHSLVLDTGPLIKNDPPASVLIAKAEKLYTLPNIISEIRDAATRSRVETTLLPFVTIRSPRPESLKFIADFAKKTGDYGVLSKPDMEVLALGYELEIERNGGDWRLRNTPGQKSVNGRPQAKQSTEEEKEKPEQVEEAQQADSEQSAEAAEDQTESHPSPDTETQLSNDVQSLNLEASGSSEAQIEESNTSEAVESAPEPSSAAQPEEQPEEASEGSDDEGWITPSNLKKQQAKDSGANGTNDNAPPRLSRPPS